MCKFLCKIGIHDYEDFEDGINTIYPASKDKIQFMIMGPGYHTFDITFFGYVEFKKQICLRCGKIHNTKDKYISKLRNKKEKLDQKQNNRKLLKKQMLKEKGIK